MMKPTSQNSLPEGGKARRVYLLLRDEIAKGTYQEGASLPGEQRLATMLDVSRVTIRRALEALSSDGLVEKRVGSGTVVRASDAPSGKISADFTTLMPQLFEIEKRTEARLLSFVYKMPAAPVARALMLPEGARVQAAVRVRLVDGRPISHLTTYVPESVAQNYSEADLATTPLFRLLERSGVRVDSAEQSVTATLATPDVAEALEISVGSALLSLDRIVRDADGFGVEYLSALYRPDAFRLEMKLNRVGAQDNRHWEPVIASSGASEAAE